MGSITKTYTFTAGNTIVASEHNTNLDTLYTLVNGNIENVNIKSNAAIANAKLAAPKSYYVHHIHHAGQESATVNPLATFQMPFAATLVEVSACARTADAADGDETYTIDVEEAGTSVLSSAISIPRATPNTPVVGTISDADIADNAKIEIVLTLGGTTPTIDEIDVVLVFKTSHVA